MSNWTASPVVADTAADDAVPTAVVDEHQVRAAAGTTMALGGIAFAYAYFRQVYWPLQAVSALFALEFLTRATAGLRYSPVGALAGALTRRHRPEWVSARPKRSAWTLGLAMSGAMVVITNSGIRGWLPRTICLICLTLMWLESVLGLCLGCEIHRLLVRRGWTDGDPDSRICAHGACDIQPHDQLSRHDAVGRLELVLAHARRQAMGRAGSHDWRARPGPRGFRAAGVGGGACPASGG